MASANRLPGSEQPADQAARTIRAADAQRLEELRGVPMDWDEYGAAPPNDVAISMASRVLAAFNQVGLSSPRISPSVEEGVCLSFRQGDRYGDIECFNSGDIVAAVIDEAGQHEVWEVAADQSSIVSAARTLRDHLFH